jgi:glucose-6-phosphate 1-dehydrogenase
MRSCTCASRTRSSTAVEPHLCRVCRDQHGGVVRVEDRGHFYDPVGALRDVVVNHLMQVVAAAAIEPPAGRDRDAIRKARVALLPAVDDADPANYVRGQYDGYWSIPGVATDSTTETFAAVRLDIENWRWSGVLFFIRTGKRLPVTKTELRIVFMEPPEIAFGFGLDRNNRPARDQFVSTWSSPTRVAKRRLPMRSCCTQPSSARLVGSIIRMSSGKLEDHAAASRCSAARPALRARKLGASRRQ